MSERYPMLIVGGGPVGLTLAMDLGWRGVPCLLVEQSDRGPTNPRCNTTGARSMEHYRRLGVADRIRQAGLPGDYPTTVVYRTRFCGEDIFRIDLPSSSQVRAGSGMDHTLWPTPEPQHRISQIYLEPILLDHLSNFRDVRVECGTRFISFEQDNDGVRAELESVDGSRRTVGADFLIGCDGAHSAVRRQLGIKYSGIDAITNFVSMFFRSRELGELNVDPGWTIWSFNPDGKSNILAIDGRELWLNHSMFPPDHDTSAEDPVDLLRRTVGRSVEHEQIGLVRWTGRALVADRFREGRVMLAGDAAHIWIPMAGFGMNAGVQEAAGLGWMLSGVYHGWAPPELLDAYEIERKPVGQQVVEAVARVGESLYGLEIDTTIENAGPKGETARLLLRQEIESAEEGQFNPVGLNFGYHYHDSPIIQSEQAAPPPLQVGDYQPTAQPGCRLPHFWLAKDISVYDRLGRDFTLLRVGADAPDGHELVAAADERGVPLAVLEIDEPVAAELYETQLLLVRPDQHVAWRGDQVPDDPMKLIDQIRGAMMPASEPVARNAAELAR